MVCYTANIYISITTAIQMKVVKTTTEHHLVVFDATINPIPHGIWNNVSTWGGAIMAPPSFLSFEATKSPELGLK